jgi:hypothetical protein
MSRQIVAVAVIADRPETLARHHVGKADDGVERRADLVADAGEEIGLLGGGGSAAPLALRNSSSARFHWVMSRITAQ